MPSFGADEILSRAEATQIADYVLTFSGQPHDAGGAEAGAALYTENCVDCHGAAGEGNRDLGAPRLSDPIWFYGGDKAAIATQIIAPKHGVMPGWSGRLDDVTIKQLATYVHSLGGGE